jgi:Family of unknown function (DUF5758)/Pentapeptide repeats (8 copies)
MAHQKIASRNDLNKVLFEGDYDSLMEALVDAVAKNTNLSGAYLSGANLSGAYLSGAYLSGAYLSGAKNADALTLAKTSVVPEDGVFTGWKKCRGGILVQLEILADAKRSNASGRKCRAEAAKVLQVVGAKEAFSTNDAKGPIIAYRVGEIVRCHKWDDDRWNECSGGIHFYITKVEAENH